MESTTPHRRVAMLIPSRDRPQRAMEAAISALVNIACANTFVQVVADGHGFGSQMGFEYGEALDATREAYPQHATSLGLTYQSQHLGLVGTLNKAATFAGAGSEPMHRHEHACRRAWDCGRVTHIGFMGDDHRVRTPGWDYALAKAAGPWGVAYGDDGIQHEALPTATVMSADIVRVLGKMGPPTLYHMYIDNYWEALGRGLGHLVYMPNILIEHLHPSAGLAEMDESYERTNAPEQYERDSAAWELYRRGQLLDDIEQVLWQRDEPKRWHEQMFQIARVRAPISELDRAMFGLPNDDRGEL